MKSSTRKELPTFGIYRDTFLPARSNWRATDNNARPFPTTFRTKKAAEEFLTAARRVFFEPPKTAAQPAPTPGPLPLRMDCGRNPDMFVIVTNQGTHYATTYDPTAARAILAGPEMLAALKKLVKHRTVPCRFTITKKFDDCYTCGKTADGQGGTRVCDQCAEVLDARAAIRTAEEA